MLRSALCVVFSAIASAAPGDVFAALWSDDYADAVAWELPDGNFRINATIHNVYEGHGDNLVGTMKMAPGGWDPVPPPGWWVHMPGPQGPVEWRVVANGYQIEPGEALSGFMWTTDRLRTYRYGLNTGAVGEFYPTLIPEPAWSSLAATGVLSFGVWVRRRRGRA